MQVCLKRHDESKHERGRYPCLYCEHAATRASDLKRHVESKHEMRYPCLYCEYAATRASDLKRHSKGNMKEWDIPVFIVNMLQLDASDLKRHDESKHEGGRYPCKVKVWDSGESNKGQVRWSPPINLLRFTLVMNVNIMQL